MKILMNHLVASVLALGTAVASADPGPARALAIVAPSEQRMIFDDGGAMVIALKADPPLEEGELIVLRVDEQIVVLPTGLTRFTISGVPAGTHELEAMIVDADANPVAAAVPVMFDVSRWTRI
jgi:hypothetical protein